jgi:hypothetical protein
MQNLPPPRPPPPFHKLPLREQLILLTLNERHPSIFETRIVYFLQYKFHISSICLNWKGKNFLSIGFSDDFTDSFEKAIDDLETQIKKWMH